MPVEETRQTEAAESPTLFENSARQVYKWGTWANSYGERLPDGGSSVTLRPALITNSTGLRAETSTNKAVQRECKSKGRKFAMQTEVESTASARTTTSPELHEPH